MNRWYVRYGIPAALLAVLLWRTEIWNAGDLIHDLRWWPALAALLLNLLYPLPLTLRPSLILRRLNHRAEMRALMPLALFANMASSLTPAASGEALRPIFYRDQFGVPLYEGAAAVFYERTYSFYLMALSALAALALIFLPNPVLGLAAAILILSLFHAPAWLYPPWARLVLWIAGLSILSALTRRPAVQSFMDEITKGDKVVAALFADFRLSLRVSAVTFAVFLLMTVQFWFVLDAFHERLALHEAWALLAISFLVGVASAVPMGLGTTDGALVFFLTRFDVSIVASTTITLLYRLTATLPAGILGLWGFWQTTRVQVTAPAAPLPPEAAPERIAADTGN